MPYDVKRFIFSVSLCAMLAVNPVLATAPTNDEDLGTTHDVYVESTLNQATNGIAGVSYVNRMVNAAGNAADAAEAHAAAAGAHALSAAQSADEAHKVLADKVSIDQGADNKNKAMVTDDAGSVYPGYVNANMISATYNNASGQSVYAKQNSILMATAVSGVVAWGMISGDNIADETIMSGDIASGAIYSGHITAGAIRMRHIADGAVTTNKIADNAVTLDKIAPSSSGQTGVLYSNGDVTSWSKIGSVLLESGAVTNDKIATSAVTAGKIANGAVTIEKTAGVVGMVPVGGEGTTTYGSFWIE